MKIILLYGPPAVGKLTIAKELAKITSYKLLHNHLTGDLAASVFEFNSKLYIEYTIKFRLELIKAAAKNGIKGIILTYMYANPQGNPFIQKLQKTAKSVDAKIIYYNIICTIPELKKRVNNPPRKKYSKVTGIKNLEESIKKWSLFETIPSVKSIKIDNTNKKAITVAKEIARSSNNKEID